LGLGHDRKLARRIQQRQGNLPAIPGVYWSSIGSGVRCFPVEDLELRLDLTETSRILHVPLDQSTSGACERLELAHELVRPPPRLVECHDLACVAVTAVEDLLRMGDPGVSAGRAAQPGTHRRRLIEARVVELGA